MTRKKKDAYRNYVEHPRFGRGPRITGLNPGLFSVGVFLGRHAITEEELNLLMQIWTGKLNRRKLVDLAEIESPRIANTAILADVSKQSASIRCSHYFDLDLVCEDCGRRFLFFAQEQRYWFEDLGFYSGAQCLRCIECRKRVQRTVQLLKDYDQLLHMEARTTAQNLALAELYLTLMEAGTFPASKTSQLRALLNIIAKQSKLDGSNADVDALFRRVLAIESKAS
jgi:hypothetical protein